MSNQKQTLYRYQQRALETAVYPGINGPLGIVYCALKLSGEAGELLEKVTTTSLVEADEIAKELGDIMWYVASEARELKSEIPYDPTRAGLSTRDIVVAATQVSEIVGKALRDDGLIVSEVVLTDAKRDAVLDRLATVTAGVETVARGLGMSLSDVLDANIEKLASRAKRGVLAGSGDNR